MSLDVLGNINLPRDIGNGHKTSHKTLSPYVRRLGLFALVLAVGCWARKLYRHNGERIDRCTSSLQTSATGRWKWRSSLRLRQWPLDIEGAGCQAPQSRGICHWTTLCRSYVAAQRWQLGKSKSHRQTGCSRCNRIALVIA